MIKNHLFEFNVLRGCRVRSRIFFPSNARVWQTLKIVKYPQSRNDFYLSLYLFLVLFFSSAYTRTISSNLRRFRPFSNISGHIYPHSGDFRPTSAPTPASSGKLERFPVKSNDFWPFLFDLGHLQIFLRNYAKIQSVFVFPDRKQRHATNCIVRRKALPLSFFTRGREKK